jgi:putative glutamine amidotransferase
MVRYESINDHRRIGGSMHEHAGQSRPIIGVVCSRYERKHGGIVAGVSVTYVRAVEGGGAIPLLIHLSEDLSIVEALYRRVDGLLFTGGGDVDPKHYGAERHPKCGAPEGPRDEVELWLARRALADGMPILGICRGVQLINVAMGGTLYQDIPSEIPGALDHYASLNGEGRTLMPHTIQIQANSWLANQLGSAEVHANTFHHQALKDVAPGLRVVANAPDGIVEAVEGTGNSFVAGVQCHPEDLWDAAEPRWHAMFKGFTQIVQQASLTHTR